MAVALLCGPGGLRCGQSCWRLSHPWAAAPRAPSSLPLCVTKSKTEAASRWRSGLSVQREFGVPSFRTAQGAYFQVAASAYLGPCGPLLVVDVSPVSRTSLKRRSLWLFGTGL